MKSSLKLALIFWVLVHPGTLQAQSGDEPVKPNLILILADDLGYGDVGAYSSKQIPTLNIDRLAGEGILFTNGYVSSPVCSPSRAGLMTGKNAVTFGYCDNLSPTQPGYDPEFAGLPLTEKTLAERLKPLGYTSSIVGKWHLGELAKFAPVKRGFDEFWGYLAGAHDYFNAKSDGTGVEGPILCSYKTPGSISYLTDDIGNECVDFISRHKKKPFFLYASFGAPHSPMQATEDDLKRFAHIENPLRRTYCAMVYRLDQNVGKIMAALRKDGIECNTVVVFMSDNGGPAVAPISNGSINAPLRGQKTTLLEGGIRVPYLLKWPAKLKGGRTINETVSALDICPTFVALAGGSFEEKGSDVGVNLIPFITGETDTPPHPSLRWSYTIANAIREGDWKLIQLPDRMPMLYNLAEDVAEKNDVSSQNPERSKTLLKNLGIWEVHLPHPVFREPADWRLRHLKFYDATYQLSQPD